MLVVLEILKRKVHPESLQTYLKLKKDFVDSHGVMIYYTAFGKGEPLLILRMVVREPPMTIFFHTSPSSGPKNGLYSLMNEVRDVRRKSQTKDQLQPIENMVEEDRKQ